MFVTETSPCVAFFFPRSDDMIYSLFDRRREWSVDVDVYCAVDVADSGNFRITNV